jgi:cell envelope opacity-associated protein A
MGSHKATIPDMGNREEQQRQRRAAEIRGAEASWRDLWVHALALLWQIFRVHGIPKSLFL